MRYPIVRQTAKMKANKKKGMALKRKKTRIKKINKNLIRQHQSKRNNQTMKRIGSKVNKVLEKMKNQDL